MPSRGLKIHRVVQAGIGRERFREVTRGFARAVGSDELETWIERRHGCRGVSHGREVAGGWRGREPLLHDARSPSFERLEHRSPGRWKRAPPDEQAHRLDVGSPAAEPAGNCLEPLGATRVEVERDLGELAEAALAQTLAAPSVLPEMIAPLEQPLCRRPGSGLPGGAEEAVLPEDAGHQGRGAVRHRRVREVEAQLGLQECQEPLRTEPRGSRDGVSMCPGAGPRAEIEIRVEEDLHGSVLDFARLASGRGRGR